MVNLGFLLKCFPFYVIPTKKGNQLVLGNRKELFLWRLGNICHILFKIFGQYSTAIFVELVDETVLANERLQCYFVLSLESLAFAFMLCTALFPTNMKQVVGAHLEFKSKMSKFFWTTGIIIELSLCRLVIHFTGQIHKLKSEKCSCEMFIQAYILVSACTVALAVPVLLVYIYNDIHVFKLFHTKYFWITAIFLITTMYIILTDSLYIFLFVISALYYCNFQRKFLPLLR